MRIGIDCRTILNPKGGEKAGISHYTYYLVKNLLAIDKKNTYVLFFDYRMKDTSEFEQKNVEIDYFPFSQYKKFMPFAYSHLLISAELKSKKIDIYHAPANVVPMNYNRPTVLTIHDMAIYKHPSWFPTGQNFSVKVLVPSSIKRANKIIAVSNSTKRNLTQLMKVPANKTSVVYEAGFKEKLPTKTAINKTFRNHRLNDNFVLYLGTLEARKNIVRLIKAWEQIVENKPKKTADWQLVIAGQKGHKFSEVFKAIKNSKAGDKIRYLGYVSHQDKVVLMKEANAFAFPSLWEGFGLPILEAMHFGTPVLTSNVSSMPEVAGNAAVLVNPSKIDDISKGLEKMITSKSLLNRLSKQGKAQAKKFSWSKCARETLAVYKQTYKDSLKPNKLRNKPVKKKTVKKKKSKKKK